MTLSPSTKRSFIFYIVALINGGIIERKKTESRKLTTINIKPTNIFQFKCQKICSIKIFTVFYTKIKN